MAEKTFKVQTDVSQAIASLNKLKQVATSTEKSVLRLKSALDKPITFSGTELAINKLRNLTTQIGSLKSALSSIKDTTALSAIASSFSKTSSSATRLAGSLTRIESSIKNISVSKLTSELRGLANVSSSISPVVSVIGKLASEIRRLGSTSKTASSNLIKFYTALSSLASAGANTSKLSSLASALERIQNAARSAGSSLKQIRQPAGLSNISSTASQSASAFDRLSFSIGSTVGAFLTLHGAINSIKSTFNVLKEITAFESTLTATLGSAEQATQAYSNLKNMADSLGLSVQALRSSYANFVTSVKLSGGSIEDANEAFRGMSEVLAVLKRGPGETKRAFLALTQMFQKNQVQAEELKRQLAEVVPGSVSKFAESMGVSVSKFLKMMSDGMVGADRIIPFIRTLRAEFAQGLGNATQSIIAEFNRFSNAIDNIQLKIAQFSAAVGKPFLKFFTSSLTESTRVITAFGTAIAGIAGIVGAAVAGIGGIIRVFNFLLAPAELAVRAIELFIVGLKKFADISGITAGFNALSNIFNTLSQSLSKVKDFFVGLIPQDLRPAASQVASAFKLILESLAALVAIGVVSRIAAWSAAFIGVGTAISGVLGFFSKLRNGVKQIISIFSRAGGAIRGFFSLLAAGGAGAAIGGALRATAASIGAIALAIARANPLLTVLSGAFIALGASTKFFSKDTEKAAGKTISLRDKMAALRVEIANSDKPLSSLVSKIKDLAAQSGLSQAIRIDPSAIESLKKANKEFSSLYEGIQSIAKSSGLEGDKLTNFVNGLVNVLAKAGKFPDLIKNSIAPLKEQKQVLEDLIVTFRDYARNLQAELNSTDKNTAKHRQLSDSLRDVLLKLKDLSQKYQSTVGSIGALENAAKGTSNAFSKLSKAQQELVKTQLDEKLSSLNDIDLATLREATGIVDGFRKGIESLSNSASKITSLSDAFSNISSFIGTGIQNTIADLGRFIEFIDLLVSSASDLGGKLTRTLSSAFSSIQSTIESSLSGLPNTITSIFEKVKNTIYTLSSTISSSLQSAFSKISSLDIIGQIKSQIDSLSNSFPEASKSVQNLVSTISELADSFSNFTGLRSFIDSIKQLASGLFDSIIGKIKPFIDKLKELKNVIANSSFAKRFSEIFPGEQFKKPAQSAEQLKQAIKGIGEATSSIPEKTNQASQAVQQLGNSTAQATPKVKQMKNAVSSVKEMLGLLSSQVVSGRASMDQLAQAAIKLSQINNIGKGFQLPQGFFSKVKKLSPYLKLLSNTLKEIGQQSGLSGNKLQQFVGSVESMFVAAGRAPQVMTAYINSLKQQQIVLRNAINVGRQHALNLQAQLNKTQQGTQKYNQLKQALNQTLQTLNTLTQKFTNVSTNLQTAKATANTTKGAFNQLSNSAKKVVQTQIEEKMRELANVDSSRITTIASDLERITGISLETPSSGMQTLEESAVSAQAEVQKVADRLNEINSIQLEPKTLVINVQVNDPSGQLGSGGGGTIDARSGYPGAINSFRSGGIVGQSQQANTPSFATGGIPNFTSGLENTNAFLHKMSRNNLDNGLLASIHPNEAVVPLSGGREIPVKLQAPPAEKQGSTYSGQPTSINMNVNIVAQDVNSFNRSRKQIAKELGQEVTRATYSLSYK